MDVHFRCMKGRAGKWRVQCSARVSWLQLSFGIWNKGKWFVLYANLLPWGDFGTATTVCACEIPEGACGIYWDREEDVELDCEQGRWVHRHGRLPRKKGENHINIQLSHWIYGNEGQLVDVRRHAALDFLSGWLASLMELGDLLLHLLYTLRSKGRHLLTEEDCWVQCSHTDLQSLKNISHEYFMIIMGQRDVHTTSVPAHICMCSHQKMSERCLWVPWRWKRSVVFQIMYLLVMVTTKTLPLHGEGHRTSRVISNSSMFKTS